MKNSGVEWIGEIPNEWEVKRGKELFFEINDRCKNPENYPLLSVSEYYGVAPKSEKIEEGDFITHAETLDGYKICQKGDIVQNIMLAWKRATGMSNYEGLISPAYCIYRPYKSIDSKYYHYLFRTDVYADLFKQYSTGIIDSRLRLYPAKFLSLKYAYPPKETQQRIATYLDKKCSKIEETIQNQQQVIEKLKAYKQSLITEAVTGKVKIENGKACGEYESYKESRLKWLGDFKIPKKWNSIQVKSCVSIPVVDGPHESPELFDNGIPYISATAIENSKIDFSLKRGFISEKYCDECDKRYKPMKDDILMIKLGATTGQVAIVETDERFNIWVPLAAIRCNKNIALPKFVFYSFQSDYCLKQMEMSWTFGTQQTLGVSSIERLKIFLPNIETQKEIADYLNKKCTAIDTAIEQKQKLIVKLTEYKKSLIYECVTGKKEIS